MGTRKKGQGEDGCWEVELDDYVTLRIDSSEAELIKRRGGRAENNDYYTDADDMDKSSSGEGFKPRHVFFGIEFLKHFDKVKAAVLVGLKNTSEVCYQKKMKTGKIGVCACLKFMNTWAGFLHFEYPGGKRIQGSGMGLQLQPFEKLVGVLPEAIDQLERRIAATKKRSDLVLANVRGPDEGAEKLRKKGVRRYSYRKKPLFRIAGARRFSFNLGIFHKFANRCVG